MRVNLLLSGRRQRRKQVHAGCGQRAQVYKDNMLGLMEKIQATNNTQESLNESLTNPLLLTTIRCASHIASHAAQVHLSLLLESLQDGNTSESKTVLALDKSCQ